MGCMLRCEKMTKYTMYLAQGTAFRTINELGELGCVQFIDMNPDLQLFLRKNVMEVCRFSEMERKLNYIHHEMILNGIEPHEPSRPPQAKPLVDFLEFEVTLQKWKDDLKEITMNEVSLLQTYLNLVEFHYVLRCIGPILEDWEITKEPLFTKQPKQVEAGGSGINLLIVVGVVRRTRCHAFQLMLWRISHGIIYFRQASQDKILIDPVTRQEIRKIAFLVICQSYTLAERIQKICNGFKVNTYTMPDKISDRLLMENELSEKMNDLNLVLEKTKYIRCQSLRVMSKDLQVLKGDIKKSKAVYHIMNMFRIVDKNLYCDCWIPDCYISQVNDILSSCCARSYIPSFLLKIDTNEAPPSYHRVNKFTRGFQNLINAYGDSAYRELNPGLYTLITFPFLFAMMFGDMGHGFILVLCGVWMWKNEKKFLAQRSTNEIWTILFGGRYVVMMLGLFSMFTGFIYNDMFSRAFTLYPSYWMNLNNIDSLAEGSNVDLDPSEETRNTYLFGEDPLWRLAKNKIMFENSFKMKISIIIGIIHMMFGLSLSFFNYRYFKRTYSIYLQFIPELLFLTLMFFWLVILCYLKWFMYSPKNIDPEYNTACAPQILILFIDMVLMSETKPANDGCTRAYIFDGQRTVQMILVFTAVACVPIMLLGTPFYLIIQNNKKRKKAENALKKFLAESLHKDEENIYIRKRRENKKGDAASSEDTDEENTKKKKTGYAVSSEDTDEETKKKKKKKPWYAGIKQKIKADEATTQKLKADKPTKQKLKADEPTEQKFNADEPTNETLSADEATKQKLKADIEKYTVECGEVMLHQGVHTIEFVLSTISHTASYLRLWALSLAHSQLSEMLWGMILSKLALHVRTTDGAFRLIPIFGLWAIFTVCILVVMEGLSAFLHCLRLHWVEFMSKFFAGGGWPYRPYSFEGMLEAEHTEPDARCRKFAPLELNRYY